MGRDMGKEDFKNLTIINHPVINDRLCRLRQVNTTQHDFKKNLREIAQLMTFEITKDLQATSLEIETPLEKTKASVLKYGDPIIIPILRAGLGLSEGITDVLTHSPIGHIGVYRDEETKRPKEYLVKLPPDLTQREILLVDPMLATGHSALHAIDLLIDKGVEAMNLKLVVLVAAPEGVQTIENKYPDLKIYTAALDRKLNENAYIMPGLGDAGDRIFGT